MIMLARFNLDMRLRLMTNRNSVKYLISARYPAYSALKPNIFLANILIFVYQVMTHFLNYTFNIIKKKLVQN